MPKTKNPKTYSIRSVEQLGDIINEKNIDIIFANLYGSAKKYIAFKNQNKKAKPQWLGINWIDDGKVECKGLSINVEISNIQHPTSNT